MKEVDFEQQLAVGRLRGPEKTSHAQALHKQRYSRRKCTRHICYMEPTCNKTFIIQFEFFKLELKSLSNIFEVSKASLIKQPLVVA